MLFGPLFLGWNFGDRLSFAKLDANPTPPARDGAPNAVFRSDRCHTVRKLKLWVMMIGCQVLVGGRDYTGSHRHERHAVLPFAKQVGAWEDRLTGAVELV